MKKKSSKQRSPVAIYKKKAEVIYNTTVRKTVHTQHTTYKSSNKENISTFNDYSMASHTDKCPFDSPTSIDFNFDTSEIFSNMRRTNNENMLQNTYDKSYSSISSNNRLAVPQNVLQPSNKQLCDNYDADLFDNLTFTPLKSMNVKSEKLDKGPKIILSMNSDSDFDDSLDMKNSNKENETHSIICITSTQPPNKWLTVNHQHHQQVENPCIEPPTIPNKKIPNTSSPKELSSPNFSINTDFSRISDLSFFPQRFSTERKILPKLNNDTHEIFDEPATKMNSDTFTKDSPNTPMDHVNQYIEARPPHFFNREQPKMCRQALFREYQQQREASEKVRNYLNPCDVNVWASNARAEVIKSPPRSITPPLQSIPEESTQFTDTQILDNTNKQMTTFTINRTFETFPERNSVSINNRQSWSKKAIRAEPELWKVPAAVPRKSLKPKASISGKDSLCGKMSSTFESIRSSNQNISLNQVGNVYSQSSTVDPFLSSTYFYDEEAVDKFEKEFKRWLNCILTPPAELDSNVEMKIDVGKAWIENRNKEVPTAPTKEQVCNTYHNSHRLESLRKSARALLMSPEIGSVFQKLNAQIEKKLIAIRTDRNLHLDVGLQKAIMELLLSYNPLWLRIGLEAIYGLVLPLKSNSDIEGLTTFIIQRMFKNPHLKNKHSKSNAPNMLLPAYMDAIKKFTLKKFFMLVFFLDQAKQRKLISHDPCLFCRNAVCKESREVIIRFTRDLIAGIGDITKHLRPLGYVVSHKQSYLDEYKYGVHNIAVDIRDGVRLTKVMEIILMKNGLLNQLRTPAISRLQKIHNVQVALSALKEANFVIFGDITANDIADGHREKTLSLLWQLIHVFRAPLFEKAANVIQTWWRKKYEVIVEKKKEQERILQQQNNAASTIQHWWRQIQYNRLVEWKMQQITTATIVIQKYFRMWLCRSRLRKLKISVQKIEEWYQTAKLVKEARETLQKLRAEREELRRKSAIVLQSQIRRWLCMKEFKMTVKKIILIQSVIRTFLVRNRYVKLIKSVTLIQQRFRGRLIMREEMRRLLEIRNSVLMIQSYYRMIRQRSMFLQLKKSVKTLEERYLAVRTMRIEHDNYRKLKQKTIMIQALYRSKKAREEYLRQRQLIITLQRKIKAHQLMQKEKANFLQIKNAAITLQKHVRSYLAMKEARRVFITQRKSAILIQKYLRSYLLAKKQRLSYIKLRNAATILQKHYRSLLAMRQQRSEYLKLRNAAIIVQRRYRAQTLMKSCKISYEKLQIATVVVQRRYRAVIQMRHEKSRYLKLKSSCVKIQNAFRAYSLGKRQRQDFLKMKDATIRIQNWFRSCKKGKQVKEQYLQAKQACVSIQRIYRAYIIGRHQRREYLRIQTATVCIQKYFRSYIEMKTVREQYIQLKTATVTIQRFYKSYLETKYQRKQYLQVKSAAELIQNYYRRYKENKRIRYEYCELRNRVINVQRRYRSIRAMRREREQYMKIKHAVIIVQQKYRAILAMRIQRQAYLKLRTATVNLQNRFRAQCLMKKERLTYTTTLTACTTIQRYYRAYSDGKRQKHEYLLLKKSAVVLQQRYKALLAMRKCRNSYTEFRKAVVVIQRRFRAHKLMLETRSRYRKMSKACIVIQRAYKAYVAGKKQRNEFIKFKIATISIQTWFRSIKETRIIRSQYQNLRRSVITSQRLFRIKLAAREAQRQDAAKKIQTWYISIQKRNACRNEYLKQKTSAIVIQSAIRMFILRKRFLAMKHATMTIQKYYRSYKLSVSERQKYINLRTSVITLQSHVRMYIVRKRYLRVQSAVLRIQAAYKLKRQRDLIKKKREAAAICIQKNVRRYLVQSWYQKYRKQITFVQKIWKGKLVTRLIRCEFLQKRRIVIKLQSVIRGYLVRKQVQRQRENLLKIREEMKRQRAASKIQVKSYFTL